MLAWLEMATGEALVLHPVMPGTGITRPTPIASMHANRYPQTTYRKSLIALRGVSATFSMAAVLLLLTACNGSDVAGVGAGVDAAIRMEAVGADAGPAAGFAVSEIEVGTEYPMPTAVRVLRANGTPAPGVRVRWSASGSGVATPAAPVTDANGVARATWTAGTAAGRQQLKAETDGAAPVSFELTARAGSAARITVPVDTFRLSMLGDSTALEGSVFDRFGNAVTTPVSWRLESPSDAVELVMGGAVVVARGRGVATLVASADAAVARAVVRVAPAAPRPLRIEGDTVVPGVPFVITGESFSVDASAVRVDVNGVRATVIASSRTRIEAVTNFTSPTCSATERVQFRVTIAGVSGETDATLRTATRLSLAKGESAALLDAQSARCVELAAPAGGPNARYIVAVLNTNQAASSTASFELRAKASGVLAGVAARAVDTRAAADGVSADGVTAYGVIAQGVTANGVKSPSPKSNSALPAALKAASMETRAHANHMERERALVTRAGSPRSAWVAAAVTRQPSDQAEPRRVGDIVTVRTFYDQCTTGRDVRARVVYAGSKSVVLEDLAAPKAGTMDATYRAIGDEFDRVQYPILTDNLGDPLAMNGTLRGDGRVTMFFTRYVNDSVTGIAGYVSACNFYPRSIFAASNESEIFYARVPAANESAADWRRAMRSTVIHEAKHLASFAERISRGGVFEESWLEEATARVAEELYSRTFAGGGAWKGKTGYSSSVRCEVYQCDDRPVLMWKHFSALHAWETRVDELTPIGAATSGDFSYYASGWSLVRWAADQYAASEGEWLKALVKGGAQASESGLRNLASRTGTNAETMLADWALATAVSNEAGVVVPKRKELTMPSWDVADVMGGLARTYPGMFYAQPLKVRGYTFGSVVVGVQALRAYSASYFSFAGSGEGVSQVVELAARGGGGGVPAGLRVAVVRVE